MVDGERGIVAERLIAGDRSDKDQDNAREYQIQAMTEAQLLKYVRRAFQPK